VEDRDTGHYQHSDSGTDCTWNYIVYGTGTILGFLLRRERHVQVDRLLFFIFFEKYLYILILFTIFAKSME
jgi:hypothetical protein